MAYSANNLSLVASGVGTLTGKVWSLRTEDAAGTVDTAGYISDGYARGMAVGDLVFRVIPSTGLGGVHIVQSVTVGGAADLTDTTAIATDTD